MSNGKSNPVDEKRTFLEALYGQKPDGLYVLLWTPVDKQSHWFRNVEGAIEFANEVQSQDLYIGVGFSPKNYGPTRRCLSNEVAGIVGLWADLDLKSKVHPKEALPSTVEDALKILPKDLPPTFLILTGNGVHAWWLFKEPLIFETEQERGDAAGLAKRWQKLLALNAASHGWGFDPLSDLARVLRAPGTRNCKDPENAKPVKIHLQNDRRYNPTDLAEYLEELRIPDAETQEQAAQAWREKFADKPLAIDPSATVAEDVLRRCMDTDARFHKTWARQRDDLKDQSQSGYDMALVNFGFAAGLSEQQVVELIIHHRRIHHQRQRTRLDYYQRTLAKAFNRKETMTPTNSFGAPVREPGQPSPQTKPDSPTARALLCEQISSAIGVRILRIVKVDGQEPTYRLELETTKIAFASIDKLVGQQSFRMKIASAVNQLIPKLPAKAWEGIAQMILDALTVEDGGEEATLEGSAKSHIERYLSEITFIDPEEEPFYQTRYKPAVYEGQIIIYSEDLQQHINKAWGENRPLKDVTAMLSAIGAVSDRLKGTRLRDQSRWRLPLSEFPPDKYIGAGERGDARPS